MSKIRVRHDKNSTEIYLLTIYLNSDVQPKDPPTTHKLHEYETDKRDSMTSYVTQYIW